MGDLGMHERKISKWVLEKQDVRMWSGLNSTVSGQGPVIGFGTQ
jgi:hypothetical protein